MIESYEKEPYQIIPTYHGSWECRLFGAGKSITLRPIDGEVPNWFWRKMQYLLLGNEWVRIVPEGPEVPDPEKKIVESSSTRRKKKWNGRCE